MRSSILVILALAPCASCGAAAAGLGNLGFEIQCNDAACDWQLAGTAQIRGTWHPADPGLDLSGTGEGTAQQRTAFDPPQTRDYVLEATTLRDPGVTLSFELVWYAAVPGTQPSTFWAASPAVLRTDRYPVPAEGLQRFQTLTSIPTEAGGMILRVVKEGEGRCWVDEIAYHPLQGAPR